MRDLWASSGLRSSASSLLLGSGRRPFLCSGGPGLVGLGLRSGVGLGLGFGLDRIGGKALKSERSCATISGFRVYSCSGRSPIRSLCSSSSSSSSGERLEGRGGVSHFDFALRRAPYRSWIATPRPSPWTARFAVRSLRGDGGSGGELELESSFRNSGHVASANRAVKTVRNSRKGQLCASQEDELSASAELQVKSVGGNQSNRVSGGQDERTGIESFDGRGASLRGVNNSSKQFSGKSVVVRDNGPKSSTPKSSGAKLSRAPNFLKRSAFSGVASTSATVDRDMPGDRKVVPKVPLAMSSPMSSNQNCGRRREADDESKTREHREKRPKTKEFPPAIQLRRDLNMCSKDGDVLRALEIYERSISDGVVKWNDYNFNILLYLCSSAALGTLTARKSGSERAISERLNLKSSNRNLDGIVPLESRNGSEKQERANDGEAMSAEGSITIPIDLSPEVMELAARRGFEIYEDMKKQGVPPNEATLTAVARLAVKKEDGDLAFQMVKQMAAQNIAPKLRSYSPALVTFCKSKAVEKAFEVDAHMVAAGVQPEEQELGALLQLCVEEQLDKKVYSVLHRLRTRVRALSASTISSIEEWFSGQAGASAGEGQEQPGVSALHHAMVAGGGGWHGLGWLGKGGWKLDWTTIDSEGFCRSCRHKLVTIDLDSKETDNFAQSVAELAFSREAKPNDFRRFQDWLELNGPFDAIIDGANIGLYNQNFHQGGFNFFQLNAVAQAAVDLGLVKRPPLIILHNARTKFGAANSSSGQQYLRKWSSSNTLYTTPSGSNDDWYWMYAAVRNRCLLITNDEMRDHLFQLLGSDFFPKWKERHQVRFSLPPRGLQFHLPPPYSLVIQESENGSWHIPKDGGPDVDAPHEWICVTRPGESVDNAALPVSGLAAIPSEAVARPADRKLHTR